MNKRIFLDINIVIDIIDEARASHQKAKLMLIKIIEQDYEVYISEDVITTIYYVLKGNVKVLYFFKNIMSRWNVVPFGKDVIEDSIDFSIKYNSDLEDTLQCMCAKKNGCKTFITSDKKFIDCGIEVLDYEQFLR
ncbi:type II toxin-antitoxin system VapC family toxin [Sulfurimonas sp.]|uniref:type II toxin-antitoxin system VapC family toxin n=1 Tax=Sulfurimonas sp. TaxID=2022749 RepID=UPI003D0F0A29